jgi:hypothetical protein
MTKYVVSQIVLTDEIVDEVNNAPYDAKPAVFEAYRNAMMGWDFIQEHGSVQSTLDYYTPVMNVEAESLDHVYHLTNVWNDESKIERLSPCRSTSVGDLILDTETDNLYMVDGYGFRNVATGYEV